MDEAEPCLIYQFMSNGSLEDRLLCKVLILVNYAIFFFLIKHCLLSTSILLRRFGAYRKCLKLQFFYIISSVIFKNGTTPLTYSLKLSICKGVSCGLHFLHSVSNNPIIHGDVKSANILLDKHLEPKLGDFGLSRDGQVPRLLRYIYA